MFALLEIAHIYKALNLFADLQGPIWEISRKNAVNSRISTQIQKRRGT